jgi:membrane-associated phospholipid phosphatase
MNSRIRFFTLILVLFPVFLNAQVKDTLSKKLDSLAKQPDSVGANQVNNIQPKAYNDRTKITPNSYLVLLADDIKQQFTSPFRATASDWWKIGAFTAGIAGVTLWLDKPVNRLAVDWRAESPQMVSTSAYVTQFGGAYEAYTLAFVGAYGYIFKKEKMKTTFWLATQAYITAGLIANILKYLTGQQRPNWYDPVTGMNDNIFHGPFFAFTKDKNGVRPPEQMYSAFPSGHTTAAFAAATVFAMEYRDSKIIPIIAYSAASLVGISRITENQHWLSDVLVGAMLGFLSGRQVVNNYHRYSKIQNDKARKKKASLSFELNYMNGAVMPGVVVKF